MVYLSNLNLKAQSMLFLSVPRVHGLLLRLIPKEHPHPSSDLLLHPHGRAAIGQADDGLALRGEDGVPGVQGMPLVGPNLHHLDVGFAAKLLEPLLVVVVLEKNVGQTGKSSKLKSSGSITWGTPSPQQKWVLREIHQNMLMESHKPNTWLFKAQQHIGAPGTCQSHSFWLSWKSWEPPCKAISLIISWSTFLMGFIWFMVMTHWSSEQTQETGMHGCQKENKTSQKPALSLW